MVEERSFTLRSLRKLNNELVSGVDDAFICVKSEVPSLEPTANGTVY